MIATIALAALFGTAPRPNALPSTPAAAQLAFHHATYRDCARRCPDVTVAKPKLDSCANITATWPTLAHQPGVEAHLRTHVLSFDGKATQPLELRNAQAGLRQALQQETHRLAGYAQETYTVSVLVNRPGILILQDKSTFDGGGAHAEGGIQYYPYDTAHDRLLTLADVLVPGYAPKLLQLIQQNFSQQQAEKKRGLYNSASELKLTTNFLPTHQGLRFRYGAGEAGAVAAGPAEVLLTWQQLGALVRPASIVRAL